MARIVTYEKPVDFFRANKDFIYADYFAHYHLIHTIEQLKEQKIELCECYNVVDDEGSNVLCMWVMGGYYIYSRGWTKDIVQTLVKKVELHRFKHYSFCGQRELIKELFRQSNIKGDVFKNRFIEVCTAVNDPLLEFVGHGENGQLEDFEELVQLGVDYNQEEFRGQGSKTRENISGSMFNSIQKGSIYIWRVDRAIVSIAQLINDDEEFAMVGSLYTRPELRGKGYAYFLMYTVTKGLLEAGYQKCGLVSDADNIITKKIFQRVGYTPIYNWVLIRKEE